MSVPDSVSTSNATKWPTIPLPQGRPSTVPGKPVPIPQPLERAAARDVRYDRLAVQSGRVRQPRGLAGNLRERQPHSVPRLECDTTRPASTETNALKAAGTGGSTRQGVTRQRELIVVAR
ncbi:hypothetical protein [Streptomyces sp. NBC_00459]|uniref:hypothetical protein n=1 Tax=Streptomyces sp. NBC_00459 TaxID=2975749 RepID=UPI002E17DA0C